MGSTHTKAGLLALAGAARPGTTSASACAYATPAAPIAIPGGAQHQVTGHPSTTWTTGTLAKPATFMVLDRKNRPARPLSELSP
jgi:hypothetical protein